MTYIHSFIITAVLSLPAISAAVEMERSSTQLARQFHEAHVAGDYSKIEELVYWNGVEPKMRADFEKTIKDQFKLKIRRCYATSRSPVFSISNSSYRIGNKSYKPNLKPEGVLQVEFDTWDSLTNGYPIGKKGGKYYIVQGKPLFSK